MCDVQAFTLKSRVGYSNVIRFPITVSNTRTNVKLEIKAVIDTGATISSISSSTAKALNLPVIDKIFTQTAGGIVTANKHIVNISFTDKIKFNNFIVCDFIGNDKVDMLIGMDIITLGDTAITNDNGSTVFSFRMPHDTTFVDYTKD